MGEQLCQVRISESWWSYACFLHRILVKKFFKASQAILLCTLTTEVILFSLKFAKICEIKGVFFIRKRVKNRDLSSFLPDLKGLLHENLKLRN